MYKETMEPTPQTEGMVYGDEWEKLYGIVESMPAMKGGKWVRGTFYRTYGGGPEGGYIEYGGQVFEVERRWGTHFVLKKSHTGTLQVEFDDEGVWRVKFERI